MKKKILLLLLLSVLFVNVRVQALNSNNTYSKDEIPIYSYVIGTQLFTDPDNDIYNTENKPSAIYDGDVLYVRPMMFASTTINASQYSDVIVYYKDFTGEWGEGMSGADVTVPNEFYITHVNGICVLEEGCGASTSKYSVNFYDNDELKGTTLVTHGSKVEATDVPSLEKDGYKFTCWTEDLDDLNVTCYNFGVVTAPVNLYAYYEPINLKLTYHYKDANGNDITSRTYTCNVANSDNDVCKFNIGQDLPTVPSGYVFVGWSTKPNSDEHVYKSGDSLISLASGSNNVDIDLYAVYKPIEYKVSYTLNGGSYEGTLTTTYTKTTSSNVVFDFNPVKAGYKIAANSNVQVTGGSYNMNTKKITITTPNASATHTNTVTVTWTANSYTIKSGTQTVGSCTYDTECNVSAPNSVPAGKRFTGYSIGSANNPVLFVNKVKNLTTSEEAVTVYPHYEDVEYAIDYNLDGGVLPDNANLTHSFTINNKNVTLPTLSKIGYNFTGWKISGNNDLIAPGSYTINATSDVTFTAQFTKITYNIYYDNGSTSGGTCSVDGCVINKSYTPTGNNEFVGWGDKNDNPTYVFKNGKSVSIQLIAELAVESGNEYRVNLYHYVVDKGARWAFITYDLNGGTFTDPSTINSRVNITNGSSTVNLAPVTDKVGYTFNGWTIKNEAGNTIATVADSPYSYTVNQNVTAVARWKAITSTVTLHDNDNHTCSFSYIYGPNGTGAINLEDMIESNNCSSFVDDGLVGWATDSTGNLYYGTGILINNIASNTDFYAVYGTRTITYELGEGHFVNNATPVTVVNNGSTINSFVAAEKEGYNFKGWYTAATGGTKVESLTVTENTTLYAQYEVKTFRITYDYNDGVGIAYSGNTLTFTEEGNYNDVIRIPELGKDHSTMVGWNDAANGKLYMANTDITHLYGNITLKAIYSGDETYTITYNLDGGHWADNETPISRVYANDSVNLLTPEKENGGVTVEFDGWSMDPEGNVMVTSLSDFTEDVDLYAQWR